ncbi:hypothetical protein [Desulfosarcina widdelii]|uniref:hypothetical protein n=1 Tax=Desulfosarcina widdelii TaxID=947919 RepID=UPI0012D31544|nr:hypothetical protein [Desulfosarcina widdelii]
MPRDRFEYNTAIADSWKEQTLLNIVKLRYADMPLFVEVASIVSGYTLEGSVNLGGSLSSDSATQGDLLSLGTSGKYTDRPTITYAPITGAKFNHNFMIPIPPKSLLFLLQAGWPADIIFPIVVESVNGFRSRQAAGTDQRLGDPEFYRLVKLLRKTQKSGAVGMRILKGTAAKETTVLFFHRQIESQEIVDARIEIHQLLGLDPSRQEFKVTYGLLSQDDGEIAILTRSILQIMVDLAAQIDVPAEHVADGLTPSALPPPVDEAAHYKQLIQVQTGPDKPVSAYTAVYYEGHWFWIDKRDFRSKRTFAFLMMLFSLTETGGKEGLPLVTIPAG